MLVKAHTIEAISGAVGWEIENKSLLCSNKAQKLIIRNQFIFTPNRRNTEKSLSLIVAAFGEQIYATTEGG